MIRSKASAGKVLVSLRDATFRLGDRLVFENTNWCFRAGEQWGVVGTNGSGKSLFADCLRGHLPLVAGEMKLLLRPPAGLASEETIGHVSFEERTRTFAGSVIQSRWSSLEEEESLTVAEYLSYERVMEVNPFEVTDAHRVRKPAFNRRRDQTVALLGIRSLWNHSVISLSNGERQKVELARALCHAVRLLILDDPFAGLDAAARERFGETLTRLAAAGLPCMILTSREEDLPGMVNRILYLRDCRVTGVKSEARSTRKFEIRSRKSEVKGGMQNVLEGGQRIIRHGCGGLYSPAAKEVVRLEEVTIRYGEAVVLDKFSWSIRAGESWALLGPNGSGKTTILSLIQGDHPQVFSNSVTVMGRRAGEGHSVGEIRRFIGVVSPELHACFEMGQTVLDAVLTGFYDSMALFGRRVSRGRRQAAWEMQERFGLTRIASQWLSSQSTGTQRLVLLARALVKRPPILLLDEPCQALDEEHRRQFIAQVAGLISGRAVSVVYVTHRFEEIPKGIGNVMRMG